MIVAYEESRGVSCVNKLKFVVDVMQLNLHPASRTFLSTSEERPFPLSLGSQEGFCLLGVESLTLLLVDAPSLPYFESYHLSLRVSRKKKTTEIQCSWTE